MPEATDGERDSDAPTKDPLRDELARLRAVFDLSGDAIFVLDEAGGFVDANPEACRRYGYSREEISRLHISALDVPEERHLVPDRLRRIAGQGGASFVAKHLARDGTVIPSEINSRRVVVGDRPLYISICRDIRERLEAEAAQRRLEAKMLQAQKLESLGLLASGIAHDFNNLLMAILGHADAALTDLPPGAGVRDDLQAVAHAAHRAADLSRQMLAYAGKGRFFLERLDLGALVTDMCHLIEITRPKKISIRYRLAKGLPAVHADATQLRQVVMNLVINAAEAIGDRSGEITVTTALERLDQAGLHALTLEDDLPAGDYVRLAVADDGCGMDEATAARIFDPFFSTKFLGRGLGLAAVQGIVRAHRGAVSVRTAPGQGTTFRVHLPVDAGADATAGGAEAEAAGTTHAHRWRGSGLILLADDEDAVRTAARRMLERIGFQVVTAADGREAVARFQERPAEIRCVVLDLTMPRMDGVETFDAIRRLHPDARVVISSGYGPQLLDQRLRGAAPSGFIQKPYVLDALRATLREVLGEGAPAAG